MAKLNINKPKVLTAVAGLLLASMYIVLFFGVDDGVLNLLNSVKFIAALVTAGAALNVAFSVKDTNRSMFATGAVSAIAFGIAYLISAAGYYNTYLKLWQETIFNEGIIELISYACMFLALVFIGICMLIDRGLASKADGILLIVLSIPYLVETIGAWSIVLNASYTGFWAWLCDAMEGLVNLKSRNMDVTCFIETCLYVIGIISIPKKR